ncbi:hypothetical protein FRC08_001107 [Ceratobasidium sp. 394]|nr:hypothetical protein FRC08_001107 [Ceratobasidium sp. 394]KAG9088988.1 hypothetical protein FS749_001705 [Ceratobasidium sp. UAMH 11750]
MSQSSPEVYAPSLADPQIQAEKEWLDRFNQASDSLDWSRWEKFWDDNAVLQFNNVRIEGKAEIGKHFEGQFKLLKLMKHTIARLSFVDPPGLIYQNATVTYKVNGDLLDRSIDIPGLAVIHKLPGGKFLTKFETYIDTSSLVPVIKEVAEGNQNI